MNKRLLPILALVLLLIISILAFRGMHNRSHEEKAEDQRALVTEQQDDETQEKLELPIENPFEDELSSSVKSEETGKETEATADQNESIPSSNDYSGRQNNQGSEEDKHTASKPKDPKSEETLPEKDKSEQKENHSSSESQQSDEEKQPHQAENPPEEDISSSGRKTYIEGIGEIELELYETEFDPAH